jgi:putative membrane protein
MNSPAQARWEPPSQRRALTALLLAFAVAFAWSAIRPHDYFTWFLEVWPAVAGIAILAATYSRFRFTTLVYGFIWAHAVVLLIGGHYTYAEVPLFNWIRDHWHLARNDYDRVGHFMQGFVPALIARELFLRRRIVKRGWVPYVVLSVCLAISALYELLEWRTAVAFGSGADAFLGTQGDPWDTQEDMATALVGATCALLFMSRWQDRQIAKIEGPTADGADLADVRGRV